MPMLATLVKRLFTTQTVTSKRSNTPYLSAALRVSHVRSWKCQSAGLTTPFTLEYCSRVVSCLSPLNQVVVAGMLLALYPRSLYCIKVELGSRTVHLAIRPVDPARLSILLNASWSVRILNIYSS